VDRIREKKRENSEMSRRMGKFIKDILKKVTCLLIDPLFVLLHTPFAVWWTEISKMLYWIHLLMEYSYYHDATGVFFVIQNMTFVRETE